MSTNFSQIFDTLEQIEKISSTNDKIAILSKYKNDSTVKDLLNVAINPYIITQISETMIDHIDHTRRYLKETIITENNVLSKKDPVLEFKSLQYMLTHRLITGSTMVNIVADFLNYSEEYIDKRAPKWFERILSKKLRIGISEHNCLAALGIEFRSISLQAAEDTYKLNENCEELFNHIDNWIMQPKLDGFRYVLLFVDHTIRMISRTGREKDQSMYPTLRSLLMEQYDKLEGYAIDCEVTAADWNDIASVLQSTKNKKDDSNVKINAFDLLTLDELFTHTCTRTLDERQKLLQSGILKEVPGKIEIVKSAPVVSKDNILKVFKVYTSKGGEGLMLKDLTSTYKFKRTTDWLKVKQIMSGDYPCIDMYEGKGKNTGRLGGVVVVVQENPQILCKVGGGFSEEQMEYFWTNKDKIIGHIVEVEYRTKTKDGSLRHPVFLRVRYDKDK